MSESGAPYWIQDFVRQTKGHGGSGKAIPKSASGQMGGGIFSSEVDKYSGGGMDYASLISGILNTGMNIYGSYAQQKEDRKKAEAASKAADAQHAYEKYTWEEEQALRKRAEERMNAQMFIDAQLRQGATLQEAYKAYAENLMKAATLAQDFGYKTASAAQNPIMESTAAMAKMGPRK